MSCQDLLERKLRAFESRPDKDRIIDRLNSGRQALDEFLDRYPFNREPAKIDELTPAKLFNPRSGDYFFLWIGWRLKALGAIGLGDANVFRNAADSLDEFKKLLLLAVDDRKGLADKIDAPWEGITGFGRDRQIAKKIVASYFPTETLPIFNTEHMEYFAKYLQVDIDAESGRKYNLHYADVTLKVGRKWELLTEALLERKGHHEALREKDNVYFMYVLYFTPPAPLPNNL